MQERDRGAVLELADRLTVGVASWRAPELVLRAVRSWVSGDIDKVGEELMIYVAAEGADVVGFVAVTEDTHWTGERDAYIGELVIRPDLERQGVGRQLVRAAELWASTRGLRRVRLSTGAANTAALRLYGALGYQCEDVTLSRSVADLRDRADPDDPDRSTVDRNHDKGAPAEAVTPTSRVPGSPGHRRP
jgi:Acetyltransferases